MFIRCFFALVVWLFIANSFQIIFVEVDIISGFLVQYMNFKFISQLKPLFHAIIMIMISIIWFVLNTIRFDCLHFSLENAWIVISQAIMEANSLHTRSMFNSVFKFGILKNLGVLCILVRASKITSVVWYAPQPG